MSTAARQVVQNSIVRVGGYAIGAGLYFAINILLARYLGTEGFGRFSFIVAFVGVFQLTVDMGVRNILIRNIAVDKAHFAEKLGVARTVLWILSIITMGLIILLVNLIHLLDEVRQSTYLAGLASIVTFSALGYSAVLRAFEEMEWDILGFVFHKVVLIGLTGAVIRMDLGLKGVFGAVLIANSGLYLYYWGLVRILHGRAKCSLDVFAGWALLAESFPLAIAEVLSRLTWNVSKLLLAGLGSPAAVGLFSAAYRLLEAIGGFSIHLTLPVFPVFSRLACASSIRLFKAFEQSLKFLYVMGIPLAVLLFVLGDRIILLFFGEAYREAGAALKVLAPTAILLFPTSTYGYIFAALGRQRMYMGCVASSLVINIILNLLLIPLVSYIGAAIGTLAGQIVLLLTGFMLLRRVGSTVPSFGSLWCIWRPLTAGLAMGICCWLVKDLGLLAIVAGVLSGLAVYAGLLFRLKTFTEQEHALLLQAMRVRLGSTAQ
jgi:O-antigen/teichoic acid export membrane protein